MTETVGAPLADLLELYVQELSTIFAIAPDADGRFRYAKLPLYWAEPESRFAYFIRVDGDRVGFALVTRESPAADGSDRFDVAEFFVHRAHRGSGVGRRAAFLLWNRLPGEWVVRVSEGNAAALSFWHHAVRDYTDDAFSASERPGSLHRWRVFEFHTCLNRPR